jgi:hypothetical protein
MIDVYFGVSFGLKQDFASGPRVTVMQRQAACEHDQTRKRGQTTAACYSIAFAAKDFPMLIRNISEF